MPLIYNLFHHFHFNGCISITMFLDCDLNYGSHFPLNFCCLMTLFIYLGVRAEAVPRAGAGAGAGA